MQLQTLSGVSLLVSVQLCDLPRENQPYYAGCQFEMVALTQNDFLCNMVGFVVVGHISRNDWEPTREQFKTGATF